MRSLLALLSIVVTSSATHTRSSSSTLLPRRSEKRQRIAVEKKKEAKAWKEDVNAGGEEFVAFDTWMTLAVTRHLDWRLLASNSQCRLMHHGNTALQHCIVCMRHDMAMTSKSSSMCDGIRSGPFGPKFSGCALPRTVVCRRSLNLGNWQRCCSRALYS